MIMKQKLTASNYDGLSSRQWICYASKMKITYIQVMIYIYIYVYSMCSKCAHIHYIYT